MSQVITGKTGFLLSTPEDIDLSVGGNTWQTPVALRPVLGPLAYLTYKPAELAVWLSGGSGTVTVEVLHGASVLNSQQFNLANGNGGKIPLDLTGVSGTSLLSVKLTADTAAGAATKVAAMLYVENPLSISGC